MTAIDAKGENGGVLPARRPFARYQIVDEPTRSRLASFAVRPLWPLLGLMLGGAWLAWPWFAFNAFALGMRGRGRVFLWIAGAIGGSAAVVIGCLALYRAGRLSEDVWPWIHYVNVLLKLTVGYVLFEQEARAAELHAYFGGRLRNAWPVLAVAFYARETVAHWITSRSSDAADIAAFVLL